MNEPDGFEQQKNEISREDMFREALAARDIMASGDFGSGERAIFGVQSAETKQEQKQSKRMQMVEKLGEIITNGLTQQLAGLPEAIANAIASREKANQQAAIQPTGTGIAPSQEMQPFQLRTVSQAGDAPRTSPVGDSFGYAPTAIKQQSPMRQPQRYAPAQSEPESVVRPKELQGYPVDLLPKTPMRIGREPPMRSLDPEPLQAATSQEMELPVNTPRPMAGPYVPPAGPRMQADAGREIPFYVPPTTHVGTDPQGQPRAEIVGGQLGETSELVREFAEANMAYHDAMRMFVGMMLESVRQLTEEIYQANMALDRQERAT